MNKKIKALLLGLIVPIIASPLVSIKQTDKQFTIYYSEIDNIYTNNLTRSYISNQITNLNIPKTKEGYIFVNWVYEKYNFPLNYIPSLETGDIVLKPNLIKEYQGFKEAKRDFLSSNNRNANLVKLLDEIIISHGYKKLKLQEEFTQEFNNFKLNQKSLIENVDLENEVSDQDLKTHLQNTVSNIETPPEARLQTFKTPKPKGLGILVNLLSNFGLKEYLIGGFLSLFGLGAIAGAGNGIHKAIEARNKRLLEKSKNYKLTLQVENDPYKNKEWTLYAFGAGLDNEQIGTFKSSPEKKNNINDKLTNEGNGKFSIRIEDVNDPSKVNVILKTANEGAENQTASFPLDKIFLSGYKVYLLGDSYKITKQLEELFEINPEQIPIILGEVKLTKVI
ncbi:hypothetical protein QLQ80_00090 [Mycoplasma sp. M5725]|uniref:Uncharacterized protein n=1 Tax=Mycoplasma phocimorsus TaxID=3045839 RepID=A0AAJ1UWD4_9MOLU|nr:hypothetical protein [Mycoplasma phocimorsus]MDJ1645492.1 hypothetical protein [Mycoplasma phocimorsus]